MDIQNKTLNEVTEIYANLIDQKDVNWQEVHSKIKAQFGTHGLEKIKKKAWETKGVVNKTYV